MKRDDICRYYLLVPIPANETLYETAGKKVTFQERFFRTFLMLYNSTVQEGVLASLRAERLEPDMFRHPKVKTTSF